MASSCLVAAGETVGVAVAAPTSAVVITGNASASSSSHALIESLSACRAPILLRGTMPIATAWTAAFTHWRDAAYVAERLPTLEEAYIADLDEESLAMRHDAAASGQCRMEENEAEYFADDPSGDVSKEHMATADVYAASDSTALYYARWMGFPALSELRQDAPQHASLLVMDDDNDGKQMAASTSERRYFRLGTPGAVSSLHYDEYHNSFVQVNGSKRWWLLDPAVAWRDTRSFPRGHPRARQSPRQPSFKWPVADFAAAGGMTTVTSPGDVLYIPPYWWHQTATMGQSVAVNLWSPSREARQAAQAIGLAAMLLTGLTTGGGGGGLLCVGARAVRSAAAAFLVGKEQGQEQQQQEEESPDHEALVRDLLFRIYDSQNGAHMRRQRRRASAPAPSTSRPQSSPSSCGVDTAAAQTSALPCAALGNPEREAARRLTTSLLALPEGVRELTLGDVVQEIAGHLEGANERNKARAVRCLLLDLQ